MSDHVIQWPTTRGEPWPMSHCFCSCGKIWTDVSHKRHLTKLAEDHGAAIVYPTGTGWPA